VTLFAGVDVGTGGARCLIVDERGRRVAAAEHAWRYRTNEHGLTDLEPGDALAAVAAALSDAVSRCDAGAIAAIGVCSQRSGVALLDAEGAPILVGPNADGRAVAQGIEQQRVHGERIYRINGRLPAMLYLPARLAWMRENAPDDAARVAHALSLADWVVYELTGIAATERTQAAELLVYEIAADAWSEELLEALGVSHSVLPEVRAVGDAVGDVRASASERFGIPAGIPVVSGGADTQAAALAMGVRDAGDAIVVAGNTMIAEVVTADATADPAGRLWRSPHPMTGRWVREAHCGEAGALLSWLGGVLATDVNALAAEAETGVPGAGGVVFVDPRPSDIGNFPLVRRAALSFPAPVLALGRPRADVLRAVFEGVAFGARAGLEWLGEHRSLALAGGVARSGVVAAALAGSGEEPVRVAVEPASSALGAAIVSASAHHGGVESATEAMHDRGHDVAPRAADGYPAHYAAWREHAALETGTLRIGDLM